jgi:hypothetical protein
MPQLVLTEEQLRLLEEARGAVDVVDSQGRPVASMSLLVPEDLEAIERWKHSRGLPRGKPIPGHEVQAFLRKLHEIADQEGIDKARVKELLKQYQPGEQALTRSRLPGCRTCLVTWRTSG